MLALPANCPFVGSKLSLTRPELGRMNLRLRPATGGNHVMKHLVEDHVRRNNEAPKRDRARAHRDQSFDGAVATELDRGARPSATTRAFATSM